MTIISTEVDDSPEEMYGKYVDNRESSLSFLDDIIIKLSYDRTPITKSLIPLSKLIGVSTNTMGSWIERKTTPSKINANKITFIYILIFDQVLFMSLLINSIDEDFFGGEEYNIQTLKICFTINQLLHTITLLRDPIIEGEDYEEFDKVSFLWEFVDKAIKSLLDPNIKELSKRFIFECERFLNCEVNEINEYRLVFEEWNILNDLEN